LFNTFMLTEHEVEMEENDDVQKDEEEDVAEYAA
jgi:hypothetical protein